MPIDASVSTGIGWAEIAQAAFYIACAFASLWIKNISSKAKDAATAAKEADDKAGAAHLLVEKLRGEIAREYATKSEANDLNRALLDRLKEIKEQAVRIEEKLDRKQDKPNGR